MEIKAIVGNRNIGNQDTPGFFSGGGRGGRGGNTGTKQFISEEEQENKRIIG